MPTKKELDAMQRLIDDFKAGTSQDSNTEGESEVKATMDAFELADLEAKRKARLAKFAK